MLGDDAQQPTDNDGDLSGVEPRIKSGPRHAAPRKSLLTKLHVPAGKAVALAAMPTAVLMGMGLTPRFALADDQPSNASFTAGSCVTQSDTPSPTDSAASETDGSETATPDPSASPSASDAPSDTPTPSASPTASPEATTEPTASAEPKSVATAAPTTPTPSPTASSETPAPNLLDGVGNLLGGLLGGGSSTPTPAPSATTTSPAPAPSPSASTAPDPAPSSSPSASPSSSSSSSDAAKTTKDLTDAAGQAVKDLTGATGTPSPSASPSASSSASSDDGGTQPYPCPTSDPDALANAQTEDDIPLLPNDPWTLKSTLLSLHGVKYEGIVKVETQDKTVKDVLKFTATGIDIANLKQIVQGPNNTTTTVSARAGSTSTFTNGTVTMYTESISGNLLGLIPITFSPDFPPPVMLPELFFTDVTVVQAGQFGGDLHIPGMEVLANQPAS